MVVTIHQPEHIPWLGYFDKMKKADLYVILDNVQFTKNNFQNRNKIYCPTNEWTWLTAPVKIEGHISSLISEIPLGEDWNKKYWSKLENSYRHHPYYSLYIEEIRSIVFSDPKKILTLNLLFIEFFRRHLNIKTPLVRASELKATGKRSELLANICSEVKATAYLSGPSGRDYLDMSFFQNKNIEVIFHSYKPAPYPSQKFIPYLSTLDLLFNVGPNAKELFEHV